MHNISKDEITALLNQLSQALATEKPETLLELSRDLHEKLVLFNYQASLPKPITTEQNYTPVAEDTSAKTTASSPTPPIDTPKKELTVQERIEQIMATAPKFDAPTNTDLKEEIPATTTETSDGIIPKTASFFETKEEITPQATTIETSETPKESNPFFTPSKENEDNISTIEKPIKDTPKLTENLELKTSLEEEFKGAISADYAADLFEKAAKVTTKKSLNDSLSQTQIQIGLNDRIAFVKYLFEGSQTDFNRVLSQLNSFSTEEQAKHFINATVKPDYNWADKPDYEERFMGLIERRFL